MENKEITKTRSLTTDQLLNDLRSGLTRWKKEDIGFGSIEEKYNLSFNDVKTIVAHPKIRGVRTKIPSLVIIDNTDDNGDRINSESESESGNKNSKFQTKIEVDNSGIVKIHEAFI